MDLPIAKPPWSKLGKRMESMVRKALFEFELLGENEHNIAIALSGGKDSLTLLYLLHAISGRGFAPLNLTAVHVSGEFSCGAGVDINFLQAICSQLGVTLLVRESGQRLETLECYSCSRERRNLIFDAAKSVGAKTVAFGHHSNDSAETLLLNLLHKAEFAANLPKVDMEKYGIRIIRPLIYLEEDDIIRFAQMYDFARIRCQCPVGAKSKRREVKDLLRYLERFFPNATKNIAKAGLEYGSDKANRP